MPWKPPAQERPERDERVERYHDRPAQLTQDDGRRATLFCRANTGWTQTSGHLWWRRWSPPHHRLELYVIEDGRMSDHVAVGDERQRTVDTFDEGAFVLAGERWSVQWLDEEASERFRREQGFEDHVR